MTEAGALLEGGGVLIVAERVAQVFTSAEGLSRRAAADSIPIEDLGSGVLTHALINAHAHLDLGALRGRVGLGSGFLDWVRGLVEARRGVSQGALQAGARQGAARLLATGCSAVGDIESTGVTEELSMTAAPRRLVYREVLDVGDPKRARSAMQRVRRRLPARPLRREGLSPHAPHTVSPELMQRAGRFVQKRVARAGLPVSIHWSETAEEVQWMLDGQGPWSSLLPSAPMRSGLDVIEAAGLLGPGTSLVHGNHPGPGELDRIAAAGSPLVHCPGSHAFFGRGASHVADWLRAGVTVALGTDSLASNEDLDMRREMRILRRREPDLDPARVWQLATEGGAQALAWPRLEGRIQVDALADLAYFECRSSERAELLDELTSSLPALKGLWVAGRRTFPFPAEHEPGWTAGGAGGAGGD